jgi:hypothetical protein
VRDIPWTAPNGLSDLAGGNQPPEAVGVSGEALDPLSKGHALLTGQSLQHPPPNQRTHRYPCAAARAVLLVAGDKAAGNWKRWYGPAVALAEHRYEQWIKEVGS